MQHGTTGDDSPAGPSAGDGTGERLYSLEELADAAGMTARNVRAYQTRRLLPRPVRSGRRSVYTDAHLRRLRAVRSARARGAGLDLIAAYLAQGGRLEGEDQGDGRWFGGHPPDPGDGVVPPRQRRSRDTVAWVPLPLPAPRRGDEADARASARVEQGGSLGSVIDRLQGLSLVRPGRPHVTAPAPLVEATVALARVGVTVLGALEVAVRAAEAGAELGRLLDGLAEEIGALQPAQRSGMRALAAGVVHLVLDDTGVRAGRLR